MRADVFGNVNDFFIVPKKILDNMKNASDAEIKTALWFCAFPDGSISDCAEQSGITKAEVSEALAFWRGAIGNNVADGKQSDTESKKVVLPSHHEYSGGELAQIVESNKELSGILDECQKLLGHTFTSHETEIFIGSLFDWLGLPPDYILSLTSYCCNVLGKKNAKYIEKTAISLSETGIDDFAKLEEYISGEEKRRSVEGKLRKLFGFGERALTAAEKKHFSKYADIPYELTVRAYESMIDSIGKVSLSYMDKILDNWASEGIDSAEKLSKREEKQAKLGKNKYESGSYDFDEFLAAALDNGEKRKKGDGKK